MVFGVEMALAVGGCWRLALANVIKLKPYDLLQTIKFSVARLNEKHYARLNSRVLKGEGPALTLSQCVASVLALVLDFVPRIQALLS